MQDNNALTLEKFTPLETLLRTAAADYETLKISGHNDKSGYEVVKAAHAKLVHFRRDIEKTRKEVKAPALEFGKKVDAEAERLTGLITAAETNLKNQKDWYESAKEEAKKAAELIRLEVFKERTDALFDAGFVFDGIDYIAGSLYIRADGLLEMSEAKFAECVEIGRKEPKALPIIERTNDNEFQVIPEPQKTKPLPPFEDDLFAAARNQHDFAFSAGFDSCKRKVLEILDRPEKIARTELIRLILALE